MSEEEFAAIAEMQISETACRPLVREKEPLIRKKAIEQIVKVAKEKQLQKVNF